MQTCQMTLNSRQMHKTKEKAKMRRICGHIQRNPKIREIVNRDLTLTLIIDLFSLAENVCV